METPPSPSARGIFFLKCLFGAVCVLMIGVSVAASLSSNLFEVFPGLLAEPWVSAMGVCVGSGVGVVSCAAAPRFPASNRDAAPAETPRAIAFVMNERREMRPCCHARNSS